MTSDVIWPRPLLHFTPRTGWMNDPNGLVVHGGVHHLFFQHNPGATTWGDIHWGHASSPDLLTWTEHSIALHPDELGEIFSGSVVVDESGTAGLGVGAMVAVFTHDASGVQSQSLAWSSDGGRHFEKFAGNPVLTADEPHFRDPKVVRVAGDDGSFWLMVLAVGEVLWFCRSSDLRRWTRTQEYAPSTPWPGALLEVPDLVEIDDGLGGRRWMLLVSVDPTGLDRETPRHVCWVVGDIEGDRFVPDGGCQILDHGPHLYAGMTWDRGNREPALVGWMNEAEAVGRDPSTDWCGRQTVAREIRVRAGGTVLEQHPVLPSRSDGRRSQVPCDDGERAVEVSSSCFIVEVVGAERRSIRLRGDGRQTTVDVADTGITMAFDGRTYAAPGPVRVDGTLIVVDGGSVEVFAGDRGHSLSALSGAGVGSTTVSVHGAERGAVEIVEIVDGGAQ